MGFKMKNFLRRKLKSRSFKEERSQKDMFLNALSGKLNVNEEYSQAFRTKSYIEMLDGVQKQQETTAADGSSSFSNSIHLSEGLLEPRQELLNDVFGCFKIHHLLIDYFEASVEAYRTCELLLQSLRQTRANHRKIRSVVKLTKRVFDHSKEDCGVIFRKLSSFSQLKNPFSMTNSTQFRALHDTHFELLKKLTNKGKEIRRKLKLRRISKKVARGCLVISNAAVLVALLILAFHSLAGIVAAPGLFGCFISLFQKRDHKLTKMMSIELVSKQMDIAAKVLYIMMNDFDTLSRMVARLDGEIEQLKAIAKICVRSRKREILKEAAKEFVAQDDTIVEQMEEVEQHIYLCFLTINRSRRLVLQEITGGLQENG